MTKLSPFYTDDKTAKAILAAVKDHKAQAHDGHVTGTGASDGTTQFQNTCQFKLTADWKELTASNFVASGNKIVPLDAGAEKRPYPTTIYAYGTKPTSSKDSIVVATRRANRWILLPTGSGSESTPRNQKVRLVQPKELFPACEYKTLQDVYDCTLEYSDDSTDWIPAVKDGRPQTADGSRSFDIVGGWAVHTFYCPDSHLTPHQYWRVNLKGYALPANPNDPYADRGFYTFGCLWEALFWVRRHVETKKTINGTEYTFTAHVPDWQINSGELLPVELSISPEVSGGTLFYKPSTGEDGRPQTADGSREEWRNLGSFSSTTTVIIPAEDMRNGGSPFQFKVEANDEGVTNLTVRRPTYTLSPDSAEVAMPPPSAAVCGLPSAVFPWDSKPVPRKAANHRYWTLTLDQPEVVTKVMLDVDQHFEHYILCPGGRDAFKQDISFIYSFDLATEKWTATTFPEMQKPMYNMDAKVIELEDKTHQLVILSGQVKNGFSNIIQGYNFEKDYINNIADLGDGAMNFAGRPALTGDPMVRSGYLVNSPNKESDYSRCLMVVGGGNRSVAMRGSSYPIDTSFIAVQAATLELLRAYEIGTLNTTLSLTGNTGLPYGFFDYTTQSSNAGAVGARLQTQGRYVRHQNLPVRGILRRRPKNNISQASASNPVADFLLLGGFNSVGNSENDKTVVSGVFHSPTVNASNSAEYQMRIASQTAGNNANSFLYFPDSPYILGDCCAEYIEEWDEIICFGGRATETNTAVAHEMPLVLACAGNTGTWKTNKYPAQPNPRWSAASVLVRDLIRKPCIPKPTVELKRTLNKHKSRREKIMNFSV